MASILVDSDVLVRLTRGYPAAAKRLNAIAHWRISTVTYIELVQGCRDRLELARRTVNDLPVTLQDPTLHCKASTLEKGSPPMPKRTADKSPGGFGKRLAHLRKQAGLRQTVRGVASATLPDTKTAKCKSEAIGTRMQRRPLQISVLPPKARRQILQLVDALAERGQLERCATLGEHTDERLGKRAAARA